MRQSDELSIRWQAQFSEECLRLMFAELPELIAEEKRRTAIGAQVITAR